MGPPAVHCLPGRLGHGRQAPDDRDALLSSATRTTPRIHEPRVMRGTYAKCSSKVRHWVSFAHIEQGGSPCRHPAWLIHRRSGFVGGRRSRLGAGGTPRAEAGAQAASGSRPWCRPRGGRARRWRPAPGWLPGRRQAARHTGRAAPRSAGPGPGRARSPLKHGIEHMFEVESGILLTALPRPHGTLGHIGGTEPQHPRVSSGSSRQLIGLVVDCL
jgi:hypothetical protein